MRSLVRPGGSRSPRWAIPRRVDEEHMVYASVRHAGDAAAWLRGGPTGNAWFIHLLDTPGARRGVIPRPADMARSPRPGGSGNPRGVIPRRTGSTWKAMDSRPHCGIRGT